MDEMPADPGGRNRRTVAGENHRRRDRAFELGKNFLLQRQFLRRGLKDKGRLAHRRRKHVMRLDALQESRIVVEQFDDRLRRRGMDDRTCGDGS
jgi:hypothetical protein